jgi:hypothetical protein
MGDPVQLELDLGDRMFEGKLPIRFTANDIQEGGDHYKAQIIQPWDAILAWGLGFLDGNVVKYIARYRRKGGLVDLHKARHYLQKLIEQEESKL